jgi:hypothetical protein
MSPSLAPVPKEVKFTNTRRGCCTLCAIRLVLPTHWGRFNLPYTASQQPAIAKLQSFVAEVKAASPKTRVIILRYFQPIAVTTLKSGAERLHSQNRQRQKAEDNGILR